MKCIWKVSKIKLESVCKMSRMCLEGVWRVSKSVSVMYMDGLWKVSDKCLEVVIKVSGR